MTAAAGDGHRGRQRRRADLEDMAGITDVLVEQLADELNRRAATLLDRGP